MQIIFRIFILFFALQSWAQNTVGLINYESLNADGYVLFAPNASTTTYLVDKCGNKVKEWNSAYKPGLACYLLQDGSLLRTGSLSNSNFPAGGNGGVIEKYDWNGNLTWSYTISDQNQCQHHDVCALPNGNVLAIVWDRKTKAEAIANGKNTTYSNDYLWSEKIVEIQPVGLNGGTIVWEWKVWDHLVQEFDAQLPNYATVSSHPELIHLNYFPGQPSSMDWIHFNSIDYNSKTDQILVSAHTFSEVWILDHSTSTSEATSHIGGLRNKGGDILYRWGNPIAYQRGANSDKKLYGQHHATWIPENYPNGGKILVFNNGLNRPQGNYSSVDMLELPTDNSGNYTTPVSSSYLPLSTFWSYTASTPTDFYASNISGCYPLSNGNFLISNGTNGTIFEIDANKNLLWKYINPVSSSGIFTQGTTPSSNILFRANFYPIDYAGFINKTITPSKEIELNPDVPSLCEQKLALNELSEEEKILLAPNPATSFVQIMNRTNEPISSIAIYNQVGQLMFESKEAILQIQSLEKGSYFIEILTKNASFQLSFIKI